MSVKEILDSGANVTISIGVDDLRQVIRALQDEWQTERDQMEAQRERDNELLSVRQVIDMLKISKQTAWRWHKTNYLRHVKVGVKVMYHRGDVERILNDQQKDKGGVR